MPQLTSTKARKILRHGEVRGKPLSKKQKGFFGARAGGAPVKLSKMAKKARKKKKKIKKSRFLLKV